MATISALSQDFEGTANAYVYNPNGSPSVNNPSAIGATLITGGGTVRYSSADPKQGDTALQVVGTSGSTQASIQYDFTGVATLWFVFYLKTPSVAPAANTTIASWAGPDSGGAPGTYATAGNLRLGTDMTVILRDGFTAVWTSPSSLPANTWVRIAVRCTPGASTGHRCRVYTSAAGNATSPDMDSGNVAATNSTASSISRLNIGLIGNGANTLYIDRLRGDNASEPAGLTVGAPPTVNAGPDLTKETGGSAFTITATATPGTGATISSRSWQRLSGVNVTLSGTTTDTVTVTPPTSTTGTTVLRYTATDNTGQSSTDDVTITWVAPGQTFYPVADVSNPGGWTTQSGGTTNLYQSIDEVVLDTSDYVQSPQLSGSAAVYRQRLQGKSAPTNTNGWLYRLVVATTSDVSSYSLVVKLYEADGTTLRKTWSAITTVNSSFNEYNLTLTPAEVASITSWSSGLIIEYSVTGS